MPASHSPGPMFHGPAGPMALSAAAGSTGYAYLIAAVAALGGLLFGFDTAIINGALVFLNRTYALY